MKPASFATFDCFCDECFVCVGICECALRRVWTGTQLMNLRWWMRRDALVSFSEFTTEFNGIFVCWFYSVVQQPQTRQTFFFVFSKHFGFVRQNCDNFSNEFGWYDEMWLPLRRNFVFSTSEFYDGVLRWDLNGANWLCNGQFQSKKKNDIMWVCVCVCVVVGEWLNGWGENVILCFIFHRWIVEHRFSPWNRFVFSDFNLVYDWSHGTNVIETTENNQMKTSSRKFEKCEEKSRNELYFSRKKSLPTRCCNASV